MTLISACSKTDKGAQDPQGTTILNMYDESNGKTILGYSDVYINESQNFKSSSSIISSLKTKEGLGANIPLDLTNLVKETSVQKGTIYRIYDTKTIYLFPSNKFAVIGNSKYYKMVVTSIFTENNKSVGAEVKYVSESPNTKGLPEMNHNIGSLSNINDTQTIQLDSGVEWFLEGGDAANNFNIQMADGVLTIHLLKAPNQIYGPLGTYNLHIRLGDVYTTVNFSVN